MLELQPLRTQVREDTHIVWGTTSSDAHKSIQESAHKSNHYTNTTAHHNQTVDGTICCADFLPTRPFNQMVLGVSDFTANSWISWILVHSSSNFTHASRFICLRKEDYQACECPRCFYLFFRPLRRRNAVISSTSRSIIPWYGIMAGGLRLYTSLCCLSSSLERWLWWRDDMLTISTRVEKALLIGWSSESMMICLWKLWPPLMARDERDWIQEWSIRYRFDGWMLIIINP